MLGTSRRVAAFALVCASACGTGNTSVDPGDLELRDLLGIAPEVAGTWDADQRASARAVLDDALGTHDDQATLAIAQGSSLDERVTRTLATLDARRFAAGDGALALVSVQLTGNQLVAITRAAPTVVATSDGQAAPKIALDTQAWPELSTRASDVLAAVAADAGHHDGTLVVVPAPRLAVIAGYVAAQPPRLLVNPVLIASLDPSFADTTSAAVAREATHTDGVALPARPTSRETGNPYSFYGSVAECAYAERLRCESCLPSNNCVAETTSGDGNAECTQLAANGGRGYFLFCINLSLAITSVDQCTTDKVSGCAQVTTAANNLSQLDANANFLDDSTCSAGLDDCLAQIYGAPKTTFPGTDGGVSSEPPRDTNISCGNSCSNNNSNCDASPSCSCDGPSCGNSLSCDSTCSNDSSGGSCGGCSSDSGGSSSGGGCSSDSGGSSSGGSCGSCDSGSSGCGSCDSSSGGSSGGGSCGSCDSSSGGSSGGGCGDSGGGGSCGGGGGGSCQVARKAPSAGFALALSLVWGTMPIPVAAFVKRRNRKRRAAEAKKEVV